MVQKLVIVTFSLRSPLLGVVYKPAVVSAEFAGALVFLYHIHVLVGRVSQEEKRHFFSSFLTLHAYTVYRLL